VELGVQGDWGTSHARPGQWGRLVHQQEFEFHGEGARDRDTLAHARVAGYVSAKSARPRRAGHSSARAFASRRGTRWM
jgi:hypothetical protein